jgi:ubiquinol-cytochrome c reductase cytochrome b subunit/menaquinol-cytochrome c reductase cytochrome b subunit
MPKLPRPGPLSRPAPPGHRTNGANGANGAGSAEVAKEAGTDVVGWLDERTGGSSFLTAMLYRKVPKGTNWFYTLGSATLFAFVFQALTGVFLAMYYTPSPTQAYGSITHLTNDVWMGEFVRGMHKWGASVMIICIFLHMGRVFFFGAYGPRELNWVKSLQILTLIMGLLATRCPSSALLLGDDRRQQHHRHGSDRGAVPGGLPKGRPGSSDHAVAVYAIHAFSAGIIALIGAHLYLVVKLGTTAPPWMKAGKPKSAVPKEEVG